LQSKDRPGCPGSHAHAAGRVAMLPAARQYAAGAVQGADAAGPPAPTAQPVHGPIIDCEERLVVVVWNFRAGQPDELTVRKGQELVVLCTYKDGWCVVQNEDGETGLVPANHLGTRGALPPRPRAPGPFAAPATP